jgi:hypothetical protein
MACGLFSSSILRADLVAVQRFVVWVRALTHEDTALLLRVASANTVRNDRYEPNCITMLSAPWIELALAAPTQLHLDAVRFCSHILPHPDRRSPGLRALSTIYGCRAANGFGGNLLDAESSSTVAAKRKAGSISLADDRSPIGSDASGSVDPVDAGDSMGSVWLVDYRSPIGPDASRAVDPVDASGGVGLLGQSERAKGQHDSSDMRLFFSPPILMSQSRGGGTRPLVSLAFRLRQRGFSWDG